MNVLGFATRVITIRRFGIGIRAGNQSYGVLFQIINLIIIVQEWRSKDNRILTTISLREYEEGCDSSLRECDVSLGSIGAVGSVPKSAILCAVSMVMIIVVVFLWVGNIGCDITSGQHVGGDFTKETTTC